MKNSTKDIIISELKSHAYSADEWEEYSLSGLFNKYLNGEVETSEDLTHGMSEFVEFVLDKFDDMDKSELEGYKDAEKYAYLKSDLQSLTKDFLPFDTKNSTIYLEEQVRFAGIVGAFVDPKTKILDVGAGKIPMSSIILAESRDGNVVAMDKSIILPDDVMERLGVETRREMFTENTQLDDIGIIVGNKPCSAIEPIVKIASRSGMDYIIKLCDCYAPNGEKGGVESWQETLRTLDPRIKFDETKEYVTSLPVSEKMFNTVIERALAGERKGLPICDVTFDDEQMQ